MGQNTGRRFSVAGAGNVAQHLAKSLFKKGWKCDVVFAPLSEKSQKLSAELQANHIPDSGRIGDLSSEILIIAVPDDQVAAVAQSASGFKGIVVHTAGSVSLSILKPYFRQCGVLYPVQSFTASVPVDFSQVPFCLESSNDSVSEKLEKIAREFSDHIVFLSEEQRRTLHLAAVVVNNFTNHLFNEANDLLMQKGVDFSLLEPLVCETVRKAFEYGPDQTQTGPAVRGDKQVIKMHESLLQNNAQLLSIYQLISAAIAKKRNS